MRLFLALFLALFLTPVRGESAAFSHALAAYKAGQYVQALDEFKKIAADEGQISAALCHNIANCEYRLGQATGTAGKELTPDQQNEVARREGQASIWYRRALALDPLLNEAAQNLRFLHSKNGFHMFEPEGSVSGFIYRIPRSKWFLACITAGWLTVIPLVWLLWASPRPGRRWPLVSALSVAGTLTLGFGVGLWWKSTEPAPFADRLVNTVAPAVVRSAPAEAAGSVMEVKPGSEFRPLREEGYWTYVELPGTDRIRPTRGWVRTTTVEKLWPWNRSLVD